LIIKQYIPLNNPAPKEGDVTIIGGHGNGFIKVMNSHSSCLIHKPLIIWQELYEPLWEDLLHRLKARNIKIRSIWIADTVNGGISSSTVNSNLIHDPVCSWSHARDLLHMINTFRSSILHPIIGIGHSIGASQLAVLSLLNPGLFTTLVLIEPIILPITEIGQAAFVLSIALKRKNTWPSHKEAESYFQTSYKRTWDPRCIQIWNAQALVPVNASEPEGKTKLAWERVQEMATYVQFTHLKDGVPPEAPVWTNDVPQLYLQIPNMSTHTLILCGSQPGATRKNLREDWETRMCSSPLFRKRGQERRVEVQVLQGAGHLVPLERPAECAERAAKWVGEELEVWRKEEWEPSRRWREMGRKNKEETMERWIEGLKAKI
jgi:pimeloyl-ACP methyl ester carboxylesterase